ncbi:MAG TPA: hypothetical protein VG816_11925 [Solirubrobacterales bacterium]|nr:hypothetical protein [Solirubrobacterales bacterium]
MAPDLNQPTLSELYPKLDDFQPVPDSVYVFGTTPEERSAHSQDWENRATGVEFIRLAEEIDNVAKFTWNGEEASLTLRNSAALREFWSNFSGRVFYLDITGLGHHVWAPLLRAAGEVGGDIRVVYVEPTDYTQSAAPTEGEIFDLSEKITGIAPLPGFASFRIAPEDDFVLVALLGFEGTRFAYLLEMVQPPADHVIPLVGAPGFRPEYPFYAYHGNQSPLLDTRGWAAVKYVTANCPFQMFATLKEIEDSASAPIKIAPIGTKPHSLGAILYAISRQGDVELVYDHPVRTAKRTRGASRALIYHVSSLMVPSATVA